jgi:hypothetical protein
MKRIVWLVAIGLLAAGCGPQSGPQSGTQSAATPTQAATSAPASTPQPQPTTATGATAVPTSEPSQITREQVFQIQSGEWARGAENPSVTIIEWGDYQ